MDINKEKLEFEKKNLEKENFENIDMDLIFRPKTPTKFQPSDLNNFLIHCSEKGVSDIHIEGDKHIMVDVHSKLYPAMVRRLNITEAADIIKALYGDSAQAQIYDLEAVDTNHTINREEKRYRYRINAVGSMVGDGKTVQITIRTLSSLPPKLTIVPEGQSITDVPSGTMGLEEAIWNNVAPDQGMVIVTGPTGSGKSTLLAGIIRKLLETPNLNKKIITCEAPIEYVFDEVKCTSGFISQTEIYTQLKSFYDGVRAGMRRKPDIIFIGEARDVETIDNSIVAAQTGHLLYTTSHTNSVAETVNRMINVFPESERQAKLMDIIDTTQMIVAQRLLPTIDGKRCAVKEYLVFDSEVRKILRETNPLNITHTIDGMVRDNKTRLIDDVYKRLKEGLITEEKFKYYEMSWGKHSLEEDDIFDFEEEEILYHHVKVFSENGEEYSDCHVGIVIDKEDENHGKLAIVNSDDMTLEEFAEHSNSRHYFSVDKEKIKSKKILKTLKEMREEYRISSMKNKGLEE
tara:strand:+ start:2776 stop:4326 length:1551 start_codon:yes stop_codon:yes gene_type:complete